MVMLDVMVIVTPAATSIKIFPVKLAAGGHEAPPVEVHAMAEKFRVVVTVEEQVWPNDSVLVEMSIAAKRSFIFIRTFSSL
jgi:hypothetical protein